MDRPTPTFTAMQTDLRSMGHDERAETIVQIFRVAASEWAAMVIEHVNVPPGHPPPPVPGDGHPIRELLQDLPVEERCRFLGALFEQVCQEFAALIAETKGPTH